MNFSFAGCGFLGIYHVGVASCLKEHAPHLVKNCQFGGASAGAIVACCLICDCCLGDCTTFTLRLATKSRSYSLGPLHPSFKITKILRDALREVLPENAHEIATGKLHISLTRVSDRQNVVVSEYSSREELIQALLCSAHVPFYSGLVPPSFRGVRYIDGGLSDNIPAINDQTVSISPFAGESDICPRDDSSNFLHIHLANTSMQCSVGNLYRMSRALFPPHPEILSDMCQQGFDDCLKYLQRNSLLSCVRHLSVISIVTPVSRTSLEYVKEDEDGDENDECDQAGCRECKKRVKFALGDNLPSVVGSALKEAVDSVNKGVGGYIYRNRPLRLISLMVTPWFLPADIAYTYAVRFLQYIPSLPSDIQCLYRETADLLRYLVTNVRKNRRRYTARFTCELAIRELDYNQIDTDIYPSHRELECHQTDKDTSHTHSNTHSSHIHSLTPTSHTTVPVLPTYERNVNFGFAMDFDSSRKKNGHHTKLVEEHVPTYDHDHVPSTSCDTACSGQTSSVDEPNENSYYCQGYDTFEQCLHVSNQMESIMAYYYQDEDKEGCYKFQEIYSLTDMDIQSPIHNCSNYDTLCGEPGSDVFRSSRSGSFVEHERPAHLETDMEEFVEKRAKVVLKKELKEESQS